MLKPEFQGYNQSAILCLELSGHTEGPQSNITATELHVDMEHFRWKPIGLP